MIVYIENPIDSAQRTAGHNKWICKTAGYKINIQKSKALYTNNETAETEIGRKNPIWNSNQKNKLHRNKPNQGGKRPVVRKLHNTEERN